MTRRLPADDTARPSLAQDTVFIKFLAERRADAQRDAERLQGEIDLLTAQIEGKRDEQTEHMRIVAACTAGLEVTSRDNRPAPELTTRQQTAVPAAASLGDK